MTLLATSKLLLQSMQGVPPILYCNRNFHEPIRSVNALVSVVYEVLWQRTAHLGG